MLTAQRRGEVTNMEWDQFNTKTKVWTIPRENTKSDRQHEVPLSDMAIYILENSRLLGNFVFTSAGTKPFENFTRSQTELYKRIKKIRKERGEPNMLPWRLHDLRRTAASGMAKLGVAPHVIEKTLNHTSGIISGVAAVYNRHQYTKEVGEALALWESHIQEILEETSSEKSKAKFIYPKKA